MRRYQADGFIPVNEPPARRRCLAATVTIVKGDFLVDNGSGYATNADTAFAATGKGVAAAGCVGDSSTVYVEYYPLDTKTQYIVPVSTNEVLDQDNIGQLCNLGNNDDLDINTVPTEGIAFRIDSIDITDEAIVANTYGYAIGHFEVVATQA